MDFNSNEQTQRKSCHQTQQTIREERASYLTPRIKFVPKAQAHKVLTP